MLFISHRLLFAFILFISCNIAQAETTQQDIEKAIQSFIQAYSQQQAHTPEHKIRVDTSSINTRISLAACQKKIQVIPTQQKILSGKTSLKIGCSLPQWSLYVPVYIHLYDTAVISKQPLIKGEMIDGNMIQSQSIEVTNLSAGYFSRPEQIVGLSLQRTIPAEQIITPNMIKIKSLVRQQDEVTILLIMNGMNIKTTGIALASGQLGDRIPIKNKSSQRKLEAEIIGDRLVRVNP